MFAFTCPDGLGEPIAASAAAPSTMNDYVCRSDQSAIITKVSEQHCGGREEGNPCDPVTGKKTEFEVDYSSGTLSLSRRYSSALQTFGMSPGWNHNHQPRLVLAQDTVHLSQAVRPGGRVIQLLGISSGFGGEYPHLTVGSDELTVRGALNDPDRISGVRPDGTEELNDKQFGFIREIIDPSGRMTVYEYTDGGTPYQPTPRLDRVVGPFGHELVFHYDHITQVLLSVDTPDGLVSYGYDDVGNLNLVTYPDSTTRRYFYEDSSHPHHLTGIENEKGIRYANFGYHASGRAEFTEHADGYQRRTIGEPTNGTVTVTDAKANERTYNVQSVGTAQIPMLGGVSDADGPRTRGYDGFGRGRVALRTDEAGNTNEYDYDEVHRTAMHEGAQGAGAQIRTTTFEDFLAWQHDLPTTIKQTSVSNNSAHKKTTTLVYGDDLLVDSVTVSGFRPDGTALADRTTSYTYYTALDGVSFVIGNLKQIDGPRLATDVDDRILYDWYDCDTGTECGQLKTLTQIIDSSTSLVTNFDTYDSAGRLTEFTDANGMVTEIAYDLRGRMDFATTSHPNLPLEAARTTDYEYWPNGQLKKVTSAIGGELHYIYDDAEQLREIHDHVGNRRVFTLDMNGNVEFEKYYSNENGATDELVLSIKREYDQRDRLSKIISAVSSSDAAAGTGTTTDLGYSNDGHLDFARDGRGNPTQSHHDALGRAYEIIDAVNGELNKTELAWNVNDNLESVKAPNGATTSYEYDDFGDIVTETSPDRGIMHHVHDEAGNRISMTDARNLVTTYGYDALNRLVTVDYSLAADLAERYSYDQEEAGFGQGRLTSITDASTDNSAAGSATWLHYDEFGRIATVEKRIAGIQYDVHYQYDDVDNITSITYPSLRIVEYNRDLLGRVQSVTTVETDGSTQTLASNFVYYPFGPVKAFDFGNGLRQVDERDYQYRLTGRRLVDAAGQGTDIESYEYVPDPVGNIDAVNDLIDSTMDRGYSYDNLDRVKTTVGPLGAEAFEYDGNGNRKTHNGGLSTYIYEGENSASPTNRLDAITGADASEVSLDPAGYMTGFGDYTYEYSDAGRLEAVFFTDNEGETTEVGRYVYNAQGQRVEKHLPGDELRRFWYGLNGELLAETDGAGAVLTEYVWLDAQPVAVLGSDRDGDLILDTDDNCIDAYNPQLVNGSQVDIDGDGYGNACDPDFDNSLYVDFSDLGRLKDGFFGSDLLLDLNWDTNIDFLDLAILKAMFFQPPGPKGSGANGSELTALFVTTDHLGTPRSLRDEDGVEVWAAQYETFGALANPITATDPDGNGDQVVFNLRFAGQYADHESGLHYNYFRYYAPSTGRYVTSDPIGLDGGLNTYAYVGNNPMGSIDPSGLAECRYNIREHSYTCTSNDGTITAAGAHGIESGKGECENNSSCSDETSEGPIWPGTFNIAANELPGREGWWTLQSSLWIRNVSGWACNKGLIRCGANIHLGTYSEGCITFDTHDEAARKNFAALSELLKRDAPNNTVSVYPSEKCKLTSGPYGVVCPRE